VAPPLSKHIVMNIALFCHSLRSDWNHGNAHFLRGIVSELAARGHDVRVFEPRESWSASNLAADQGDAALEAYRDAYPAVTCELYDQASLDLDEALDDVQLVLVHEWNEPSLIARIGAHRARSNEYYALFHDTHHRSVTRPEEIAAFALDNYDGVLAFGEAIRERYLARGWASRVWTWHEAADTRVFHPRTVLTYDSAADRAFAGDVIWVGNWGDDERRAELREYLLDPVRELRVRANVYGVRYPDEALEALANAGCTYGGWVPNFRVPDLFAQHRVTVHVPSRAYVDELPGIPTIRPFEAMACGIPLISAPWTDAEGLFDAGGDYLVARNGTEMRRLLHDVLEDRALARALATHGRATILRRHTCAHRVDELLLIYRSLATPKAAAATGGRAAHA
jgi:spore maturation protein CgeB